MYRCTIRNLNASLFFPTQCKITPLRPWDLQTFDANSFAHFLARAVQYPICNGAQGVESTVKYMYK